MLLAERASESISACRPASETLTLAEQSLTGAVLLNDAPAATVLPILLLINTGNPELGEVYIRSGIAHFQRLHDLPSLSIQYACRAEARRLVGDVIAVENDVRTAREWLPFGEVGPPFMSVALIESLIEQDELEAAEREMHAAGLMEPLCDLITRGTQLYIRGRVRIATGAIRPGLDDLFAAGAWLARCELADPYAVPWRLHAVPALLAVNERDRALELSTVQLQLARSTEAPHNIGAALRVHALVVGGRDGLALLREAVDWLERSPARLELARALVELGAATTVDGVPADARELLKRGAVLAEELGALALARRANAELVAAGGRPRRPRQRGWSGLTEAEQRVARLAAEGLTNRELAETLFLSQKTVESHLRNAFRKLGVSSRSELASVARG